ncbi:hypothetical protein MANES_18G095650v8 [Manihot esculenta]|uniref:Uncharacterized protein n=1 Tax=Manihot esculenta TaxID=3983 RepID=A0ACB7FZW0_MANES|nr:hypothetical protein MANES_18G095650v8 [Manihot esculenta]
MRPKRHWLLKVCLWNFILRKVHRFSRSGHGLSGFCSPLQLLCRVRSPPHCGGPITSINDCDVPLSSPGLVSVWNWQLDLIYRLNRN